MIRAVFDANVLASGVASFSDPTSVRGRLLRAWQAGYLELNRREIRRSGRPAVSARARRPGVDARDRRAGDDAITRSGGRPAGIFVADDSTARRRRCQRIGWGGG